MRAQIFESFIEVRIGRLVILILRMENSALQIQRSLELRGAVNGVSGRSGRGQSSFRFWEVSNPSIKAGFEKVNLCEDHFVIEPLELSQQGIDQRECRFELRGF